MTVSTCLCFTARACSRASIFRMLLPFKKSWSLPIDLPDENVPLLASREQTPEHTSGREWRDAVGNGPDAFRTSDFALSGFVRIVKPRVIRKPALKLDAMESAKPNRALSHYVPILPGPRRCAEFERLCRDSEGKGNLAPDAGD